MTPLGCRNSNTIVKNQQHTSPAVSAFRLPTPLERKKVKSLNRVRLFATPRTVAHQVPLSTGFFRQEYWSGLPFPSPGYLPNPGIEPGSPPWQADALLLFPFVAQVSPSIFMAPLKKIILPLLS